MIITEFYNGQGLGNQLWCYFVTKTIAKLNNYKFGIMSPHKFKGKEFMQLDFGESVIGGFGPEGGPPNILPNSITNYYKEKTEHHPISRLDISGQDLNLLNLLDNTKIDGTMQSYLYIKEHRKEIIESIKIQENKKVTIEDNSNSCFIHVRGGDFKGSSAILYEDYYKNAMQYFIDVNKNMKFYFVTDDFHFCRSILKNVEPTGSCLLQEQDINKANHHLGGPIWMDYSILNNAENIIMSASSFGWWPVWTNKNAKNIIAPKYWAAFKQSDGYWSCKDSIVENWNYMDKDGKMFKYN